MYVSICTLVVIVVFALFNAAHGADPGDRAFTALGSGSFGQAGSVGASGNLSIALPLVHPSPRGSLPLPFAVVYNGSNVIGAAGTGWDVPIAGVTWQRNLSRRKPIHRFTSEAEPVTADRILLDTGTGPVLMAATNTPNVFQPFGNGFFELKFVAGAFNGRDAAGRLWVFEKLPALFNDDFFALTRIEDVTGKNQVRLHYDVFDKFSPNPLVPPFNREQLSARELLLREIEYSHDLRGLCPKYRLQLQYAASPGLISFEIIAGRPRTRSHLLQSIRLLTSGDTSCQASSFRSESLYTISYAEDPVTGQPRLTKVDMFGFGDNGANPATAIPVVAYSYGNPLAGNQLKYIEAEHITLPAGPSGANTGLAATLGTGTGSLYGLVRAFQDFNGDGRADFLTLNSNKTVPILAINRPSALGNDFSTLPTQLTLPNTPAAPYNLGAPDLSFGLPVVANIDNTYQQLIDFNGDGRPDILIATEGRNANGQRDPNFWRLLLNQPGPSGRASDIVWLDRQIDISALRSAVMAGHVLSPVSSSDQKSKALPLERTHQAGAFAGNTVVESSVITQWKLQDMNGDGFPDFVFNSRGVAARIEQRCDATGNCQSITRQDHPLSNRLMVIYHTGPMMAGSGAGPQSVWRGPAVELRADGACGVSRLEFLGNGMRRLTCGFLEANGDGLLDYVITDGAGTRVIRSSGLAQAHDVLLPENQFPTNYSQQEFKRAIPLPGPVGVVKDPRSTACPSGAPGSRTYEIEQLSDLRDVTGDGIADYVFFGRPGQFPGTGSGGESWWFMAGNGMGFAAARSIAAPASIPFALHKSLERCDGQFSNVIVSLQDLDGDGRPEIVRASGAAAVTVAKLVDANGQLGAHSAGQVIRIDNRYGSVMKVTYGSAKSDWLTDQNVPFPQIVVTQTEQLAERGLGNSMAPVRYAYGSPELLYHPLLARWVFRGYRRRIEIRGEGTQVFGVLKGTALITAAIAGIENSNVRDRLMLTGRTRNVRLHAGSVPTDPRRLLASSGALPAVGHLQTVWRTKALPGAVPPLVPLEEECYATPLPQTPGIFPDLTLCRRAATAFIGEQVTSEGPQSWPHPSAVASRTRVMDTDDFGRPLSVAEDGDLRTNVDDVCMQIQYASPVAGAPLPLGPVQSVRAHECGNPSRRLSGVRFEYDGLPSGQSRHGFPTGRVLERFNVATATLIENVPSSRVQRDGFGNIVESRRTRADGAITATKLTYDPFGLAIMRIERTATGLPSPLVDEAIRDPHTLLPLSVFNTHRAGMHYLYDQFSRIQRVSLTFPGDDTRYVLLEQTLSGFDGALGGRSIREKVFHKKTPEADAATAPRDAFTIYTAMIDEFGRRMHGIADLGPDHNNQSLVVHSVRYDELGRLRFAADPFASNIFGPRYGVTLTYRADGRPECMIEGSGVQTTATTDETLNRYPTCATYLYQDGRLLVRTQGPNELAIGKPQSGAFDEVTFSGTGQMLSRRRVQGTTVLELAEYGYDRLGMPASLKRSAAPGTSSTSATWTWSHDSLGNVLQTDEPAGVSHRFSYDDWGNMTAARWRDSTGIANLERGLHFSYDGLSRLLRSQESVNGQMSAETLREYFYDAPSGHPEQFDTDFLLGELSFALAGTRTVSYGYDALGRKIAMGHREAGDTARFAQRLQLGPLGDAEGLSLLTLDVQNSTEQIRYAYDSARHLRSVTFQDETGTSELWRAEQIDIFGRVLRARLGNGAIEHATFRGEGRRELQSTRIESGANSRTMLFDSFDGAMLLSGTHEVSTISPMPPTSTRYTYDARNALARAVVATPAGIIRDARYTYDGLGNLRSVSISPGGGTKEIRPDKFDPDRICSVVDAGAPVAPCTHKYDALGNLMSVRGSNGLLLYDGSSRIRSASRGSNEATMDYDPFGRLASLRVGDGTIQRRESFFGPVSRVTFFDAAGNPTNVGPPGAQLHSYTESRIATPAGSVAALRKSNSGAKVRLFPFGESQGTRAVLGGDATPTQAINYDAYGSVLADNGNPASLTFWPYQWNGGHVLKGLDLVLIGQRVLDSGTGRFLQRDTLINGASSFGAHPYSFAWNNPVSFLDTSGAEPAPSNETAIGSSLGGVGRFLQSHDFKPGEKIDAYIQEDWACGPDRDCIKIIEQVYGGLTEFEEGLRKKYHSGPAVRTLPTYNLILDKNSGALLGYAFINTNVIDIYDRSGESHEVVGRDEGSMESFQPTDLIGGPRALLGKRAAKTTVTQVEKKLVTEAEEVIESGIRLRKPPPFQLAPRGTLTGGKGFTDRFGNIFINRKHFYNDPDVFETIFHEGAHRFFSIRTRGTLTSAIRRNVGLWFYNNSRLVRYTEEAIAETVGTLSLRKGLAFPITHGYVTGKGLAIEGFIVGGSYGGLLYGSYKLGEGWIKDE